MPRTLDTILSEINQRSDPQRSTILQQVADLPKQQLAQEQGLRAQLDQANTDILGAARRRGLGFSGIPVGEQAKYAATEFAPALARNADSFNTRRASLESALAGLGQDNYNQANSIYNQEQAMALELAKFEESKRQFNLQQEQARQAAAAQNSLNTLLAGWGQGKGQTQGQVQSAAQDNRPPIAEAFKVNLGTTQVAPQNNLAPANDLNRLQGAGAISPFSNYSSQGSYSPLQGSPILQGLGALNPNIQLGMPAPFTGLRVSR